jgi:hypothetical protein
MSEKVKLSYKGKDFEFPLVEGSENEKGIDKITSISNGSNYI